MPNIYRILIGLTLAVTTSGALAGGPAARLGDATTTGGMIATGAPTVLIGGKPAARVTDTTISPAVRGLVPCVGGLITTGSPNVLIGGLPAAHVGSRIPLACALVDTVVKGASTVLIN